MSRSLANDVVLEPIASENRRNKFDREPPPETPGAVSTRLLILLSFWFIVAVPGVWVWLRTTSIHRSNLPLESINSWADGNACQLSYPLHVQVKSPDPELAISLATQVQGLLNVENELDVHTFHITADPAKVTNESALPAGAQHAQHESHESAILVNVQADKKAKSMGASLQSLSSTLDIRYNPARSADSVALPGFIANEIRNIFDHEKSALSYLLAGSSFATDRFIQNPPPEAKSRLDGKTTRAFKYASTYHLTFSLFTTSALPSEWEIKAALEETIRPLLERMSSISRFTVDTQVQLYASFSPSIAGPRYNPSSREWQLQRSDLSGFINAAEWPLGPSIGPGPTINFVLFVPSKEQSPLVLAEGRGSSWLIPQWGGVRILNPTNKQTERLTMNDLRPAMLTFADQLLALVGLPDSPPSLALRISSSARERTTSLILSASSTLGALARLTHKLQSIAIPDSVANSVAQTIHRLDESCQNLHEGNYQRALEHARVAEDEAEQAFFEPSMVGQVYFPEEHKVAVYVPLLGPMAVPLIISALKELRKLRAKKFKIA